MHISEVRYPNLQRLGQLKMSETTYTKHGKIGRKAHPDVMVIDYDELQKYDLSIRKDPRGRIYILTIDGKIVKIGGSQAKGGILDTIGAYLGGGKDTGRGAGKGNSKRTYAVWKYLIEAVKEGKKVEVFFKLLPTSETLVPIPNLFGEDEEVELKYDFHVYEENLVRHFEKITGRFPILNTQEAGIKWEDVVDISEHAGM